MSAQHSISLPLLTRIAADEDYDRLDVLHTSEVVRPGNLAVLAYLVAAARTGHE